MGYTIPEAFCHTLIGAPMDLCHALTRASFGKDFPVQLYFETADVYLAGFVDTGLLQLKAGVSELLTLLEARNIRKAVATSSSRQKAERQLERVSLLDRFEAIVTRDDVARGKPNPDLFLRAAEKLETSPERCLVLEDSYNGVRAAHAAGMRVIMVPDLLQPTMEMEAKAYRIVASLHAVAALLQSDDETP
jgi:HAD superfamily hydrolase (TIGR01509 family)